MKAFVLLVMIIATTSGLNYFPDYMADEQSGMNRTFDVQSVIDKIIAEITDALSGIVQGEASRSSRRDFTQDEAAMVEEKIKIFIVNYLTNP